MEENQDGLTGLTRKRAETLMNEVTDMYSSMETKWLTTPNWRDDEGL